MSGGVIKAAWIQGLLQGVPIASAAVVTFFGLRSWRNEAIGRRRIELAEQCLSAGHEVVIAVQASRGRFSEIPVELAEDRIAANDYRLKAIFEYLGRAWSRWRTFQRLYRMAGFYIDLLPPDIPEEFAKIITELQSDAELGYHRFSVEADLNPQMRNELVDAKMRFYGVRVDGRSDPYGERLTATLDRLEAILREHLRRGARG